MKRYWYLLFLLILPLPWVIPMLKSAFGKKNSSQGPADNSRCLSCHTYFAQDRWLRKHAKSGVGCVYCHGASVAHCKDEKNNPAPDRMFAQNEVAPFCLSCHEEEKLRDVEEHKELFASGSMLKSGKACSECHDDHKLELRTVRWDRVTGKRLTGVALSPAK